MQKFLLLVRTVFGVLQELGDENAYRRYLSIHGRVHSVKAYQAFQAEHFKQKYQRAKCC